MSDFLMSLKDVTLVFGGPSVLDGVSLSVSKGLRAAHSIKSTHYLNIGSYRTRRTCYK